MLKKLRNKNTSKKIWIILTILILPAFVLWGSGSIIRSRQETGVLGKIFGKKISSLEYKDALQAVKNLAIIQFGDNLSEVQKYLNLEAQAWERIILLVEAKRRKIKISDKEIIELIQSYPFFQKKNRFDQAIYSSMLEYVFRTPTRIFEEQIRQNLMLSKLYKEVTNGLNLTDEEIKKEYRKNNEQVSIYYIASLYDDFVKDITPSDGEIKDYFTKNSFQFRQPLSFNIEYASLSSEDKDRELIKDKIKKLFLRLNKKEDFIKVAKDFNLTVKESGLFKQTDPIPGIGWSPEIFSLISKLKAGEFLPPISMDKYYYIIRIKEKKEPYIPDFETIKDKVKDALIKDTSQRIARGKLEDCLRRLKEVYQMNPKSVDFDQAAKEFSLKSGYTDLFKYGSYIEGIGASDIFWINAQNLKEDAFSEILEMPSGLYIIKMKLRLPLDEKKIETEKDEFAKKLLLQKKQEYFTQFLEDLKIKVQAF